MEFTFVFIVIDEMIAYQHTFKIHAVLVSVMSVITFILSLGYDKKKKLGWYHLDFTHQKKKKSLGYDISLKSGWDFDPNLTI